MRAQVLADLLDNAKEARRLLVGRRRPLRELGPAGPARPARPPAARITTAVAATIAKIRARWKEAAAADLLDAQLALEQGNLSDAVGHFDAALKKDPGNKLVQFWKAQIDSRLGVLERGGAGVRGARQGGLDQAARLGPLAGRRRQVGPGEPGAPEQRPRRRDPAVRGPPVGRRRSAAWPAADRWQLVAAYAAKGQWPAARKEIAALLNDPKTPPTNDERVRAANYYRQNKEDAAAVAQLDYVLKVNPAQPVGGRQPGLHALGVEEDRRGRSP